MLLPYTLVITLQRQLGMFRTSQSCKKSSSLAQLLGIALAAKQWCKGQMRVQCSQQLLHDQGCRSSAEEYHAITGGLYSIIDSVVGLSSASADPCLQEVAAARSRYIMHSMRCLRKTALLLLSQLHALLCRSRIAEPPSKFPCKSSQQLIFPGTAYKFAAVLECCPLRTHSIVLCRRCSCRQQPQEPPWWSRNLQILGCGQAICLYLWSLSTAPARLPLPVPGMSREKS